MLHRAMYILILLWGRGIQYCHHVTLLTTCQLYGTALLTSLGVGDFPGSTESWWNFQFRPLVKFGQ